MDNTDAVLRRMKFFFFNIVSGKIRALIFFIVKKRDEKYVKEKFSIKVLAEKWLLAIWILK